MRKWEFAKKEFLKSGFCVLENVYGAAEVEKIYHKIHLKIEDCANELNCRKIEYLRNISRWVDPSPLTSTIYPLMNNHFSKVATNLMGQEVQLEKVNIISKSPYAAGPVPCHQDIAYSKTNPYQFSLWLALQDVNLADGTLEFLPGSQLEAITPAIDFWQPNFEDKIHASSHWQENFVSVPVKAGDIIAFDSRIWHRSGKNQSNHYRFALVSRWRAIDYVPPLDIPEKIPVEFGMWNCGQRTEYILKQGLLYCFDINASANLETYIHLWQENLNNKMPLKFSVDLPQVQKALKDLWILHRATQLHNGGDAQGVVYPNLWHIFLTPLSNWLHQFNLNSKGNIR